MPRPRIQRWVRNQPPVTVFKPAGVPTRSLSAITLRLDEYEALRLADYEGLHQEEVAERLGVSRPTVSRILEGARRTVASAFVEGRALFIEGGPVAFAPPWGAAGAGCRQPRHRPPLRGWRSRRARRA